jgi:hypothetical protein
MMSVEWLLLIVCVLVILIMLLILSRPHHLRWEQKLGLWLANWRRWWQNLQEEIECAPLQQKLEELLKGRWDVAERLLKAERLKNPDRNKKWGSAK